MLYFQVPFFGQGWHTTWWRSWTSCRSTSRPSSYPAAPRASASKLPASSACRLCRSWRCSWRRNAICTRRWSFTPNRNLRFFKASRPFGLLVFPFWQPSFDQRSPKVITNSIFPVQGGQVRQPGKLHDTKKKVDPSSPPMEVLRPQNRPNRPRPRNSSLGRAYWWRAHWTYGRAL